jgi:RHS repeat-associated protein
VPADGVFDRPGDILAKVTYTAFGEPVVHHPLDFDGDGRVGGEVEQADDFQGLLSALASYADFGNPHRLAWGNYANPSRERVGANVVDPATELGYFTARYPQQLRDLEAEFGNLPLYAGYWWDPQLKLYHVRNRVYDPSAGRWLQRDPIGYAGGLNLYQYVGNMPYGAVDPLGLDATLAGGVARGIGLPGLGEVIDDIYDGGNELADTFSGERSAGDAAWAQNVSESITGGASNGGSGTTFANYAQTQASDVSHVGYIRQVENDLIADTAVQVGATVVGGVAAGPVSSVIGKGGAALLTRLGASNAVRALAASGIIGAATVRYGLQTEAGAGTRALAQFVATRVPPQYIVREGIYEFTGKSGLPYIGQSRNIAERLQQHITTGKLPSSSHVNVTEVLGGKTSREIAEQMRIISNGGLANVENVINPIGPRRAHLLTPNACRSLGY